MRVSITCYSGRLRFRSTFRILHSAVGARIRCAILQSNALILSVRSKYSSVHNGRMFEPIHICAASYFMRLALRAFGGERWNWNSWQRYPNRDNKKQQNVEAENENEKRGEKTIIDACVCVCMSIFSSVQLRWMESYSDHYFGSGWGLPRAVHWMRSCEGVPT